jgi:hypothetical protein
MNRRGFSLDTEKLGSYAIIILFAIILIGGLTYILLNDKLPGLLDSIKNIFGFS